MNKAFLLGFVGKDAEIRDGHNGDKIGTFSLATSKTWTDKATGEKKENTEWHTIVVFNQNLISVVENYVKKGTRVSVEGMIKTRKWQDKNGNDRWSTEIVIDRYSGELILLGQAGGGGTSQRDESSYGSTSVKRTPDDPRTMQGAQTQSDRIDDADIPF